MGMGATELVVGGIVGVGKSNSGTIILIWRLVTEERREDGGGEGEVS